MAPSRGRAELSRRPQTTRSTSTLPGPPPALARSRALGSTPFCKPHFGCQRQAQSHENLMQRARRPCRRPRPLDAASLAPWLVPALVSVMPPAQAHSLRAMPSGSSLPMEPASVAPASTAMHAEGEVPLTSSASRDAAQCTNALQDDSSNSPELDPCESEGSCKLLWVCGTWPQHGPAQGAQGW